jgi:hypothetical protein
VLKVSLDTAYPSIIAEASDAIEAIRGRRPWQGMHPGGSNCVNLVSYWKQWPCLFPQHGRGRKHLRPIELADWQRSIISEDPRLSCAR